MKALLRRKCGHTLDLTRTEMLVTFLNPYSYSLVRGTPELLEHFDSIYPDGALFVKQLKLIGVDAPRRSFDMTSVAPLVFERAAQESWEIALVGAAPGVAQEAARRLQAQFGRGKPLFTLTAAGYFASPEEREALIKRIVTERPDVVVVGMGTPLQEQFLVDLVAAGWRGQGFTCGGFLHQTASRGTKYYPVIFDRLNLRWVYRILDEPKLAKRYFWSYPVALAHFFLDCFAARAKSSRASEAES